jgi:hypothetical protein
LVNSNTASLHEHYMDITTTGDAEDLHRMLPAGERAVQFSDLHPAPRRRWMTMISGQIDIQLADGTIYSFGPEDLRLWENVPGEGHRTRFPVPSVSISMPLPD